jgi:hypothetical protein
MSAVRIASISSFDGGAAATRTGFLTAALRGAAALAVAAADAVPAPVLMPRVDISYLCVLYFYQRSTKFGLFWKMKVFGRSLGI